MSVHCTLSLTAQWHTQRMCETFILFLRPFSLPATAYVPLSLSYIHLIGEELLGFFCFCKIIRQKKKSLHYLQFTDYTDACKAENECHRVYTWGVEQVIVRHSLLFVRKNFYFWVFRPKGSEEILLHFNRWVSVKVQSIFEKYFLSLWYKRRAYCLCGKVTACNWSLDKSVETFGAYFFWSSSFMFSFRKSVFCSIKKENSTCEYMSSLCFFQHWSSWFIRDTYATTLAATHSTCLTQALTGSVGMRGISNYSHDAELKYLHLD